jgi:hypothetical protein
MRFTTLSLATLVLAAGAAFGAAARSETTTYVDGNLTGVTPQTGGTLLFSDDKAMYFRTGLATVPVPYANITKAELGGTQVHSHNVPAYKVWALHKKFAGKTETQLLMVAFKNDEGEEKTMTLELAHNAASTVVSTINSHRSAPVTEVASVTPAPARQKLETTAAKPVKHADEWWGDTYWKTARNASSWGTVTAATDKPAAEKPAQQQR